jgi:hypothetical protein
VPQRELHDAGADTEIVENPPQTARAAREDALGRCELMKCGGAAWCCIALIIERCVELNRQGLAFRYYGKVRELRDPTTTEGDFNVAF